MQKLAVIINKPDRNQLFNNIANFFNSSLSTDKDLILFYIEMGRILIPSYFSMMEVSKCLKYDGTLISTDIETTKILLKNQNSCRKLFYVHELEWIGNGGAFEDHNLVYNNEDIELVVPSEDYFSIVAKTWKEPIAIVKDNKYEHFFKL